MTRPQTTVCRALLAFVLAACALPSWGRAAEDAASGRAKPTAFLVLPVTSDEEGLGEHVQRMLRWKARRLGAVVYDPASVRDALAGETITRETSPERVAELARERFKADIAVFGHVLGTGPYEVRLRVIYLDQPQGERAVEKTYACSHHQVIPLETAKAVYEILGIPEPPDPWRQLRDDADIQRRWREGPNLVRNPGFEEPGAAGDGPAQWQPVEKEMAWAHNPDGPGKVLKFEMTPGTAAGYGLDYYSDWIRIEPGAVYRFSCRYKSLGPTVKIFLKGYHSFPAADGYPAQRRETYRRQVHPSGETGRWHEVVADFIPEATRPEHAPTFLKVDLFACYPAGVVYWDDVVLKKVCDAPVVPPPPAPAAAPPGKAEPAVEAPAESKDTP